MIQKDIYYDDHTGGSYDIDVIASEFSRYDIHTKERKEKWKKILHILSRVLLVGYVLLSTGVNIYFLLKHRN